MNNSKEQTGKEGVPTKQEITEEAKLFRINEDDDGAFCGFIAGAEWMEQQLEPKFTEIEMECKRLKAELKRKDEAYRILLKKFDQFANLKHIDEESGEEHSGYHLAYAVRFAAKAIIQETEQALNKKL